jgi:hypothetical protein
MSGEIYSNESVSQSFSHRVNFQGGGVYTIYVCSDLLYLVSQCFEGYLGDFSCLT